MTEYYAYGDGAAAALIPDAPAIYLWTVDFTRLVRLPPDKAIIELTRLLRLPIRSFDGRIPPYYAAEITDVPPPLSVDRSAKLLSVLQGASNVAKWLLLYATALQRPLYVGQTSNLNNRFRSHVRPGSLFRTYLDDAGLTLKDCSMAYIRLPTDLVPARPIELDESPEDQLHEAADDTQSEAPEPILLDVLEALLHRLARPLLARKIE